jgi:hypothetical protein
MDASTHANRKGEAKNEHGKEQARGRDDLRDDLRDEGGAKGRYEGGRDADQPRQSHPQPGQRHGRDPADVSLGKVAGRIEDDE